MLCIIFKYKITKAHNAGFQPDSNTLRHISSCRRCRTHYNKLIELGSALSQMPDSDIGYYDFNLLNQKIYNSLDKTIAPISLPNKNKSIFTNNYALAATMLLAASLAIAFFASDANNDPSLKHHNIPVAIEHNHQSIKPNDIFITSSPQIALLYQLSSLQYEKLADMSYKNQYERSKEVYARTSEITEKSTEIISALAQSSFFFLRPF